MLELTLLDDHAAGRLNIDLSAANAHETGLIRGSPFYAPEVGYGDGVGLGNAEMGNAGFWLVSRQIWPSGESPEVHGPLWKGGEKEHLWMLEAHVREPDLKLVSLKPLGTRLEFERPEHTMPWAGDHKYILMLALRVGAGGHYKNHMGYPVHIHILKWLKLFKPIDFLGMVTLRLRMLVELTDIFADLLQMPGKLLKRDGVLAELAKLGVCDFKKSENKPYLDQRLAVAMATKGTPTDQDIQAAIQSGLITVAKIDSENSLLRKNLGIIGFPTGAANNPVAAAEILIEVARIDAGDVTAPVTIETGQQTAFLMELDTTTSPHPLSRRAALHLSADGKSNEAEWAEWMADPSLIVENTDFGPRPKAGLQGRTLRGRRTALAHDHSMKHRNKRLLLTSLHNGDPRLRMLVAALLSFTNNVKKAMNVTSFLEHVYGWKYLALLYQVLLVFADMPQPLRMFAESIALSNFTWTRKARALQLPEGEDGRTVRCWHPPMALPPPARPEFDTQIVMNLAGAIVTVIAAEAFADDNWQHAVSFANEWVIFELFEIVRAVPPSYFNVLGYSCNRMHI
jgi:hypothetical protein